MQNLGTFRLVRDPGHWGAPEPRTLVLGISKGNTQSKAFTAEPFDEIAFKGTRHRLLEVLQAVGLLEGETPERFGRRFSAEERDFAFASAVRCSLTGLDLKKGIHTADSPTVIPAFDERSVGNTFVRNCVDKHLVRLPERTKAVLLLGNSDGYVKAMARLIAKQRGPVSSLGPISYISREVPFVHVAHPSGMNGHFGAFVRGEGKPGLKRDLARRVLAEIA